MFDDSLSMTFCNQRYIDLLGLPADLHQPGARLHDIALFLADRGDYGEGAVEQLAADRIASITAAPQTITRRSDNKGKALEFHSSRLANGGLVISLTDVTSRLETERELARVNQTLERRVKERTAALTRANTELEAARAKADAANLDKTRFLAAASHDLLQPLNAARLYTSTLIERAKNTGVAELADSIEASLSAVEEIMSVLLDISRIDSGAVRPSPKSFPLSDLLRKIEVEFRPMARERDVCLRILKCSETVVADRALLGRIVQNLVSNALKYTRPGGRVLIGVRRRGNRLRLDIIDTGIGFSRDQHKLLFAEFSRLEQGARMAQGLGLGLSIVQRLVATLGLSLELDSAEARGSRFSLILPAARRRPSPAEPPETLPDSHAGVLNLRVLCVDNEPLILEAMQGLLGHWGCDVRCALSLKQIDRESMLEGWYPDLVLMDYHLEQTSGLDAIEWLRHNLGGHLPAALVTADRSPSVRALAEDRGIPVIMKPVKPAALRATITTLANQSRRGVLRRPQG
ncbi:hypothetical protein GCM10007989_29170 [Devosia pacifica]|uniref:histidine kinase n=1 Tax=Devosia pacifica TaxID=1335967 RepID=A0A918SAE4_9HYPH|nr:hypothetical protein GCM10007989_29170 [Devosia pacifica]